MDENTTPTAAGPAAAQSGGAPVQPIFTIGHSTRPLEQFIALLRDHGVALVADVRTVPRSRHNPQFNRETLPAALAEAGIGYSHLADLGGLRHTTAASINTGWRNDSFRGFADYMQTEGFAAGLAEGDAMLGPLARQFRGFRPPRFPSVFETLANAISCQQITLSLGITLLNRLIAAHGQVHPAAAAGESGPDALNAFPTPEDLAEAPPETLRPLGFSGQKARYLTELAGAVAAGELDLETLAALDNAEAAARLRQLRGVGRWTAEYALLRGLGRLDTFPGDDAGARNGLQRWLGLTEKLDYDGVQRIVGRWQPYAGLVYFHLLLASLDKRGVIGEMAPVAGD